MTLPSASPVAPLLRLGTRGSPLARAQAQETERRLVAAWPELAGRIETVVISTSGDRILDRALAEAGGKGLFTKEIEDALIAGRIDLAVHSLKDMATDLPPGLEIATVLPRADPSDCLIFGPAADGARTLADLPAGARIGSASLRRRAQLLARRPDLEMGLLRGSVGTRLEKLQRGEVAATLLAQAGLTRLGLTPPDCHALGVADMLPAVAQGAIGIEIRSDDAATRGRLAPLDDRASHIAVRAERALLAALDGSCRTPIAGLARLDAEDRLTLDGLIALPDGTALYRRSLCGSAADAMSLGAELGAELKSLAGSDFFDRLAEAYRHL